MLKQNVFIPLLILSIVIPQYIFPQSNRDYKAEFESLHNKYDKDNFNKKAKEYLDSLSNSELDEAIPKISKDKSSDYIAYNLFHLIKSRLRDKEVRKTFIKKLVDKKVNSNMKIVSIDFLSKFISSEEEIDNFDANLITIAKDASLSDNLRSYAAAHSGLTNNHEKNKKNLKELLKSKNLSVVNGVSRSIKRYLISDISEQDKNEWVDGLIEVLEKTGKKNNLTASINALGYSKNEKAKKYLTKLFGSTGKFVGKLLNSSYE